MKYLLFDRLSGEESLKLRHNRTDLFVESDHHDYHPHFELYYNPSFQQQRILVNNQLVESDVPTVVILSPFAIHNMTPRQSGVSFESWVLHFRGPAVERVGDELLPQDWQSCLQNCVFLLTAEENERLFSIFSRISDPQNCASAARIEFLLFLDTLFRLVPAERRICVGRSDFFISNVLSYIYENIRRIHSTKDLLSEYHCSSSTLERSFRRVLGLSPHQIIVNCRTARAIDLLRNTDLPISQVAEACGFSSEYYFYVFFKGQTGKTPSQFRS